MSSKIEDVVWKKYKQMSRLLKAWGLKKGYIAPYNEELIQKLRTIYYGGIPASILLLSNFMSNGRCYDSATLLARSFLDEDDDVNLIYAKVNDLRLNPKHKDKEYHLYADHCIVERITKNGNHYIYDTSVGLVFEKWLYWLLEHPIVRKVNDKDSIKEFVNNYYENNPDSDKYAATMILPMLEKTYTLDCELYAMPGIELLQREIELYKKNIDYDRLCTEITEDKKRIREII